MRDSSISKKLIMTALMSAGLGSHSFGDGYSPHNDFQMIKLINKNRFKPHIGKRQAARHQRQGHENVIVNGFQIMNAKSSANR